MLNYVQFKQFFVLYVNIPTKNKFPVGFKVSYCICLFSTGSFPCVVDVIIAHRLKYKAEKFIIIKDIGN